MTETMVSPVETALENQRIGSLQIRVVALCGLVQICDAFDVNSIGIVVPSLTHAWNLPGPAFTVAFYGTDQYILQYDYEIGPPWDEKAWATYQKISYPFLHADRIKTRGIKRLKEEQLTTLKFSS